MSAMLLSGLLLLAPGADTEAPDELTALETAVGAALDSISPSVVTIETVGGVRHVELPPGARERTTLPERPRGEERPRDGKEEPAPGGGDEEPEGTTPRFDNEWAKMLALPGFKKAEGPTTGLAIARDGWIVTSAWNFESDPQAIVVTLDDGTVVPAKLHGIDRAAGLALLKVDAELTPATMIDPETVREGAWAFAVGRALDRERISVKYGIISARNRVNGRALQTDAATSPSNYGGPLIDLEGHVYGVIVPLGAQGEEANPNWYDSGIGFAVPLPDPAKLIERLGEVGTVLHPAWLGVAIEQDRTDPGARIESVAPESPASRAGVKPDDVVVEADGEPVPNAFALRFAIGRKRAGDALRLTVERAGERVSLDATLAAPPTPGDDERRLPVPMPGPRDDQ